MMRSVNASEELDAMEGEMDEEEERIVDEEGGHELQDKSSAGRGRKRQRTPQLQGRSPGEIMQRGKEEARTDGFEFLGREQAITARPPDVRHRHPCEFLDHSEVHHQQG